MAWLDDTIQRVQQASKAVQGGIDAGWGTNPNSTKWQLLRGQLSGQGLAGTALSPWRMNDRALDPGKPPEEPPSNPPYYGPNYRALAAANKNAMNRQVPIWQNQWKDKLGDIFTNIDNQEQAAKDAEDLANGNASAALAQQRSQNANSWYILQQKENNMHQFQMNNLNNQHGSIRDSWNHLQKLNDDIGDQNILAAYNQGAYQIEANRINDINNIYQGLDEMHQSAYQQLSDLWSQLQASSSGMANDFLSTQAAYNDRSMVDANGNPTQAGWDQLKEWFGLVNDGTGKFKQTYDFLLSDTGLTEEEYLQKLADLQRSHTPLQQMMPITTVRSLDETTDFMRGQGQRNSNELQKASKSAANQVYYGGTQERRYG